MSTSDKLTYLSGTKDKLKTTINYTGANITNDTFRSYPEKLYNKYIDIINNGTGTLYSNMPKVNGQGDSITLNNTESAPMLLSLYGETQQDSTTGKNLLRNDLTSQTINGLTITINDDKTIKINGTASANTWLNINSSFNFESGKTYILSGCPQNGSLATYYMYVNGQSMQDVGSGVSKTFSENITTDILIKISKNAVLSNLIFKPMLRLSNTTSDYEPYTGGSPAPSPLYPFDIHNVSGDNTIEICGKNLFDKSKEVNSTYTSSIATALNNFKATGKYATGYTSNGTSLSNNANYVSSFTHCVSGITYSIKNMYSGANFSMICFLDENGNVISHSTGWSNIAYTHTATSEEKYIMIGINTNDSGKNYLDYTMIIVGDTPPTTYEAYQGNSQLISLGSIELNKIDTYQDYIYKDNDIWYLHKEIGKAVFDGSESWNYYSTGQYFYKTWDYPRGSAKTFIQFISNRYENYQHQMTANDNNKMTLVQQPDRNSEINISNHDYTTPADFKTWLSTHNTIVYYVLATPTDTEITDTTLLEQLNNLEQIKSKKVQTNINQENNDLPFIITASALKEYE